MDCGEGLTEGSDPRVLVGIVDDRRVVRWDASDQGYHQKHPVLLAHALLPRHCDPDALDQGVHVLVDEEGEPLVLLMLSAAIAGVVSTNMTQTSSNLRMAVQW